MKLSEIMASGDIGVRSLPGCWRGHRLNKRRKEKKKPAAHTTKPAAQSLIFYPSSQKTPGLGSTTWIIMFTLLEIG